MKTTGTKIRLILVIGLAAVFAASCKKDSKTQPKSISPVITGPYLYVGGAENNKGVYWKTSLSATTVNAVADTIKNINAVYSLITSNKDVYITGANGRLL